MEKDIKKINLLTAKWWNPLFWLVVLLAPVFGIIAGTVAGAFCGLLIGYERGLETACNKLDNIISKLP